ETVERYAVNRGHRSGRGESAGGLDRDRRGAGSRAGAAVADGEAARPVEGASDRRSGNRQAGRPATGGAGRTPDHTGRLSSSAPDEAKVFRVASAPAPAFVATLLKGIQRCRTSRDTGRPPVSWTIGKSGRGCAPIGRTPGSCRRERVRSRTGRHGPGTRTI